MTRYIDIRRTQSQRDRGDTLIEVLIALAIIALAVGPLFGALIEAITGSSQHRGLAEIDTMLRSFADTATSEIELSPTVGEGTLNGTTATSTALFGGTTSYVGYPIFGAGLSPTTVIVHQTKASHSATLSVAALNNETTPEPLTIGYGACSSSYHLLSNPSKLSGPVKTPVTVFATGFSTADTAFSVSVGGKPVPSTTVVAVQTTNRNGVRVTFLIPATATPGPQMQPITVSSGGVVVSSLPGTGFRVTSGPPSQLRSSYESGYSMGISSIAYWTPKKSTPTPWVSASTCTGKVAQLGGVERITISAHGPSGVSDQLAFVVRNPAFSPGPTPTPKVSVTAQPPNVARPPTYTTNGLVFHATVFPVATNPRPTGVVSWVVKAPNGQDLPTPCAAGSPPPAPGAGNSEIYTCDVALSPASLFGTYEATATYPGDPHNTRATGSGTAKVYAPNGSGTATVSPKTVKTSSVHTYVVKYTSAPGGMGDGQVDVTIPAGWTSPEISTPSGAGYCSASGGDGAIAVSITSATSRRIIITGVTFAETAVTKTLTIVYKNATAPATAGTSTFSISEASVATDAPVSIPSSPKVKVHA